MPTELRDIILLITGLIFLALITWAMYPKGHNHAPRNLEPRTIWRITTATGSIYEFDGAWVTRLRPDLTGVLRNDGSRIKLLAPVTPEFGHPMILPLEPLDPLADVTVRVTSPVTNILHFTEWR